MTVYQVVGDRHKPEVRPPRRLHHGGRALELFGLDERVLGSEGKIPYDVDQFDVVAIFKCG